MWRLNNKLLVLSIFSILFISCVYAQQSPGNYRQGSDALLFQICGNCTYVNITNIVLGDKTNLTISSSMTKQDTYYWYVLNQNYTQYPGTYIVNGKADPDGQVVAWSYQFTVSPLALTQTTPQSIGSAIYMLLMVILMLVFGGIGLRLLKSGNWWIMGIFLSFFASILLVYNTFLGYQYYKLFTGFPDSSLAEIIFWILLGIIVLSFLASVALLFLNWKKAIRYVKREIKRKDPNDEDLEDYDVDRWAGETWNPRQR